MKLAAVAAGWFAAAGASAVLALWLAVTGPAPAAVDAGPEAVPSGPVAEGAHGETAAAHRE